MQIRLFFVLFIAFVCRLSLAQESISLSIKSCADLGPLLEDSVPEQPDLFDSVGQFDQLVVSKNSRVLWAFSDKVLIRKYSIALGSSPIGKKTTENDKKTPEGLYSIDGKNLNSAFYRALHISYPAIQDQRQAQARQARPGFDIMLHGFPLDPSSRYEAQLKHQSSKDWTDGCVAVADHEIDEIYSRVDLGTPLLICP